jgi:integrase
LERHIIPGLDPRGSLPVRRLTKRRIEDWMRRDPGSRQTVRLHHGVLRNALNTAVGDLIPSNPAAAAKPPERSDFRGSPLTFDEAKALLAVPGRLAALWRLALVTGLREGELLGLGWEDLTEKDDGSAVLSVVAQLQRVDGAFVRGPTKAARSLESLSLDATTVALLDEHRKRQARERQPEWRYWGLMFVKPNGQPYHSADCLREFHAACDVAGVTRRRFHDLRGTSATLMKDIGIAEDVRMARLGHETKDMARHYGKDSQAQDRAAVERLEAALA